MANDAPFYRVHLLDEATVVERGERVRVWFLPFNDDWIRAKDHPNAELEEASTEKRDRRCPPGTIWRRSVEIRLAPGTSLLSRVSTPLLEKLGTMDYLTSERRGMRRHMDETWFEVVGNYRLRKVEEPSSFTCARKEHHDKIASSPARSKSSE